MPELYYLDQIQSSQGVSDQPSGVSSSPSSSIASTNPSGQTATNQQLATRVESLEKYVDDLRTNSVRQGGDANLNDADIKNRLTANFGKIGGWDINAGLLSTPKIQIDSNNEVIQSTDYQTGVRGFKLSKELVEAENAIIRGTMRGSTFAYDHINAVGGQLMVSNADTLAIDMTSLDTSTLTTKGDTTFAVNDLLVLRGIATSGIQEEWMRVTAKNGNVYTVTRDLAALFTADNNPTWKSGTPVVKQGSSDGVSSYSGGWLRLIGEGTNSPYYSVFKRTGVAYNSYVEVARLGNLNGFLGYATNEYGVAIGDSSAYLKYDPTNGLRISGNLSVLSFLTAGEDLVAGNSLQIGYDNTSGTFYPSDDSQTISSSPSNNYGSTNPLSVRWDGVNYFYSWFKFDLSSVPNANLVSATFYVYGSGTGTMTLKKADSSWSEGAITYNNQPTVSTTIGSVSVPASNGWMSIDITTEVSRWLSGTDSNFGFRCEVSSSSTTTSLSSKEAASNKPYLVLNYNSSKVFKADSKNSSNTNRFIGFCSVSTNANSQVPVEITGQSITQSGLTTGSVYYLTDTRGSIGTSPGTVSKKIGMALSATNLLILNS